MNVNYAFIRCAIRCAFVVGIYFFAISNVVIVVYIYICICVCYKKGIWDSVNALIRAASTFDLCFKIGIYTVLLVKLYEYCS